MRRLEAVAFLRRNRVEWVAPSTDDAVPTIPCCSTLALRSVRHLCGNRGGLTMKIAAVLGAAILIGSLAGCTQPPAGAPALGCYDDPTEPYSTWDIRLTAPLGTVGNAEMLYGSSDGSCSGDVSFRYIGTIVRGDNAAAACDEAVGPEGWAEEIDLAVFTRPASLAGNWMCMPAIT